jgi:uncharacterized membrane protein YtjA (UPF0391 family)
MTILLVLGIVIFVVWLAGLVTGTTLNGLVHIALVIAVVLLVIWLLRAVFRVF